MSRHSIMASAVSALLVLALAASGARAAGPAFNGADVLAKSRATYAALTSYSDTGVVTTEFSLARDQPPSVEHSSFRTAYQAPRKFLLDFHKPSDVERTVIWSDGEQFHTWWSATGVHDAYPRGQGSTAFAVSSLPTLGAVMAVPPLLFSQAGLHGTLTDFELTRSAGIETLERRSYYRLEGMVSLAYGTGAVSGGRSTTIWIDTETLLVGKILEDTPSNSMAGTTDRVTTRYLSPQRNPPVDPKLFQFVWPKS